MKKFLHTILLALAIIVSLPFAAFAESIEGRVAWAERQGLGVTVYDAEGRPYPNTLSLSTDQTTQLNGINSVSELNPGDPIGADIRASESGSWAADSITLFQQMDAQPATKRPSSSLSGALGNPMVKGALLGAATGAIASGSSGGKAGKGALIGAGVGALLGGILNQSDSSSQ